MNKNTMWLLAAGVAAYLIYKNQNAIAGALPAGYSVIKDASGKIFYAPTNEQFVGGAQPVVGG